MSEYQRRAKRRRVERACAVDDVEAADMIFDEQLDSVKVKSFVDDYTYYDLKIDVGNGSILSSCSCPDYQRNRSACKHMYLVSRMKGLGLPGDDYMPLMDEEEEGDDDDDDDDEHFVSTAVTEEEKIQELKDGFKGLKHEVLELATYASEELTVDNYDISTGPHFMRWAAQLHQIVNEMKAYRNTSN